VAAVLGAVLIELVRARGRTSGDVALAVLFYGGIAGGVVLLSLAPRGQATNLDGLPVRRDHHHDHRGRRGLRPSSPSSCSGRVAARASGCTRSATTRSTPARSACRCWRSTSCWPRLVAGDRRALHAGRRPAADQALMIVPSAVAQQLARSFRQTLYLACGIGLVTSVAGTTAVVLHRHAVRRHHRAAGDRAVPAGHDRGRGARGDRPPPAPAPRRGARRPPARARRPGCGHPAVLHGDHVDYDHDGHLHAPHRTGSGVHYDEHGEHAAPPAGTGGRA
jgi:zinc transport system permease protein